MTSEQRSVQIWAIARLCGEGTSRLSLYMGYLPKYSDVRGCDSCDSGTLYNMPFLFCRAHELPQHGSVEIPILLGEAGAFLPLLHELYITSAADIIWRWMSGALLKMGGREEEAKPILMN